MKFQSLTSASADSKALRDEYKSADTTGIVRLGENHLFFRRRFSVYYISYQEITRCFRRVMTIPSRRNDIALENLVIFAGEEEAAQIQLPGTLAARHVMDELKRRVPNANFSSPAVRKAAGMGADAEPAEEKQEKVKETEE